MLTRLDPRAPVSATRWASPPLKRAQRAVERQIAQPNVDQVPEPRLDLLEHHAADLPLPVGQFQRAKELQRVQIFIVETSAMFTSADARGQRLGPQPRAAALGTGAVAAPAAQKHAQVHLVLAPLEPGEEAVEPAELSLGHALDDQRSFALGQSSRNGTSTPQIVVLASASSSSSSWA